MSQSRFSIVLVGVSALLRRPLVSRLRPADGERSPWVVFAARVGRFDSGFRSAGWPSGSPLPLFGMHRFGDCLRRVRSSAFRFGDCRSVVGLRIHRFRFSARSASEWLLGEFVLPPSASEIALGGLVLPLGGLVFGLISSAFRPAPFRRLPSASSFFRLPFRSCRSAGWPSGSPLPLFGTHRFGVAVRRVGLRAHGFRFSACTASGLPSASWFCRLPFRRLPLGGLAFGLTASAFRHAPLRRLSSASWPSGSRLPLFGTRRSAPPHRRSEDRRSTTTRHLFHFKTLIPTC